MSREITSIAIEAEESETARGGFRPSSPGRQRCLQGSFEEGPSGGLSLLAEAAGTFASLGEPIWSQSTPQVGLVLNTWRHYDNNHLATDYAVKR